MKTRFPSILGVFAAILMVASFVVPMNIAAPSPVSADPGIMKWDTVSTPGAAVGKNDIMNSHVLNPVTDTGFGANTGMGSEILDMAAGNDGVTMAYIVRNYAGPLSATFPGISNYRNWFYYSNLMGIADTITRMQALARHTAWAPIAVGLGVPAIVARNLFQVAIAPDDAKVIIVTASDELFTVAAAPILDAGPRTIWITTDAGQNWEMAFNGTGLEAAETIRAIDISIDYGGKRDIGFATVNGTNGGRWAVRSSSGFTDWRSQLNANGVAPNGLTAVPTVTATGIDYMAIKFSPTYNGDSSVALVYAANPVVPAGAGNIGDATLFNVAFRDLNANDTLNYAYGAAGVEVKNPASAGGASPNWLQLNAVDLQLPSDFSGQSSSLRRAYISLDAYALVPVKALGTVEDGIYRVDDTVVYVLMDTTSTLNKSIYTIAYFGTYASGKLLAGERLGFACTATVPTWFTDSPTTCPIPCWYPALKPTTGAANQGACTVGTQLGDGGALVLWNVDGSLGLVGTGSLPYTVFLGNAGFIGGAMEAPGAATATLAGKGLWFQMQGALHGGAFPFGFDAVNNDESAFAISRNNGETWNQLSLIDTTIDWFNDVAVAPDCTTIYLASANRNTGAASMCNEFDSVWRATINPNVAAPLPAVPPLGQYWERVYTRTTSGTCAVPQTDLPILRLVPSCTDKKDGEIVGWAAQGARASATAAGVPTGGGVIAWSPDYGDYWANVTPRDAVQDFAFESSTTLYNVSAIGLVQRLPYTGTSWSTNLPSYDTTTQAAHTIVAVPDGKVLVGAGAEVLGASYMGSYSADKGVTFVLITTPGIVGHGNEHVIFDVDFKNNSFIYMADDNLGGTIGTVYRNTVPSFTRWVDNDMMSLANGAYYTLNGVFFGATALVAPWNWPALNIPPHTLGQFGIVQAWTGEPQPALYSAHAIMLAGNSWFNNTGIVNPFRRDNSGVCRTLKPRDGMPKPGIGWDCLDIFAPLNTSNVSFTLEPTSLKYCGCCTLDTNTSLYAIDDERGAVVTTVAPLTGRWNMHRLDAVWVGNTAFPGYTPAANQGMLWAYTDCLAKKGPILKSPADKFLIGADPVSGRNQQIDLSWEQLCLSTSYQLQIGKDAAFTLRINPAISNLNNITAVAGSLLLNMDTTNMTSPAAWIAPGALPEAGAIYYWRIRSARSATSQIAISPWSEARSFTVKAGFIVNTPYYGVQLLAPNNGCIGCKVKPASFSWSPWKEATKYQFDLAKDPEFKTLVVTATTTTTGYEYSGTLDYSTNYFWRVKALEVNGLNIPSDWSATFSMQTEPAPAPPAPPPAEPATPVWVWVIIAIGAILVIVTLVLIFKTRRV